MLLVYSIKCFVNIRFGLITLVLIEIYIVLQWITLFSALSAHVSCSPNRFLACFLPPNWPPYQQLHQSLTDGTAIAYLTGERQADAVISRNCVLKPYDFAHDGSLLVASGWELGPLRYFCVNLDVDKSQNRLPCGLMYFKNEVISLILKI